MDALVGTAPGLPDLLASVGRRVQVLHGPGFDDGRGVSVGGDLDCAVLDHDPWWPLRLPRGWRLCQCLHYDITGSWWVLERDRATVALDVLDDRAGIGRYGFPTSILFGGKDESAAGTAAYLAAKRLRKRIADPLEWERIGDDAAREPVLFTRALQAVLGDRLGAEVAGCALARRPPPPRLLVRARRRQQLRRVRTPSRLVAVLLAETGRLLRRLARPTGLLVVVVGPDGTGKTTLTEALLGQLHGAFRRTRRLHWRPGLLPSPGTLVGERQGDPSEPHGRPPRGRLLSLTLLAYYWLDFLLGDWLRIRPERVRSGLVLLERGWYDIAVDPRRYRLLVPPRLVRALGRLLPRPDLVLVLQAPAEHLIARKRELDPAELDRQLDAWRTVLPATTRRTVIDVSEPLDAVVTAATAATLGCLQARAMRRLNTGWTVLPWAGTPRWWLPRGPARAAGAGLSVYQPVTPLGRIGWRSARAVARLGGFRLTIRGPAPPQEVLEVVAPHLPPGGQVAVMRANRPGRFVVLLLDAEGSASAVAKVALDQAGRWALAREAAAIGALAGRLVDPLAAPDLVAHEPGLLVTAAVPWRARRDPWKLPLEVAAGLGAFYGSGARSDGAVGPSHGDCAPWNLLRSTGKWVLVDWEEADSARAPFYDLFHYLVQACLLLGRPAEPRVVEGALGDGPVGRLVRAYADAGQVDAAEAPCHLGAYLRSTIGTSFDRGTGSRRRHLLARLEAASP